MLTEKGPSGASGFTEVTDIGYVERDTEMLTFELASGSTLTATENHEHFISEAGRRVRRPGADLKVGMVLASTRSGANGTIVAITKSASPGKWSLATKACAAFANGILTATSCSTIDVSMPARSARSHEPRLARCERANDDSVGLDDRARTKLNGTQAFKIVLYVDGEEKSTELGPGALGRAVDAGLSWHMKAVSMG